MNFTIDELFYLIKALIQYQADYPCPDKYYAEKMDRIFQLYLEMKRQQGVTK